MPITISQAILGTKLTIETVSGKLNIEVPEGTQDGDTLQLVHYGAYEFNPPDNYDPEELRGNHILTFKLHIPTMMSEK